MNLYLKEDAYKYGSTSCYYYHDHKLRYFLCSVQSRSHTSGIYPVSHNTKPPGWSIVASIPTLPRWDTSVDCSSPHSILLGFPQLRVRQYWPFEYRIHSVSYHLSANDKLHLLSLVDCKCPQWLLSLAGEQATAKIEPYNIFTLRCSNKHDSETDRNCSTSPAPSHSCETISEESEDTTTIANTSTAVLHDETDAQQQVSAVILLMLNPLKIQWRDFLNRGLNQALPTHPEWSYLMIL